MLQLELVRSAFFASVCVHVRVCMSVWEYVWPVCVYVCVCVFSFRYGST